MLLAEQRGGQVAVSTVGEYDDDHFSLAFGSLCDAKRGGKCRPRGDAGEHALCAGECPSRSERFVVLERSRSHRRMPVIERIGDEPGSDALESCGAGDSRGRAPAILRVPPQRPLMPGFLDLRYDSRSR